MAGSVKRNNHKLVASTSLGKGPPCPRTVGCSNSISKRKWGPSSLKGIQNLGQSLPNRLILMIVLACRCCTSDFNVVIPEICTSKDPVNITALREMVLLGIREHQPQLSLNILAPQEICDGSNGLLKFLSLAKEKKNGQMIIASLEPHLCQTAATFRHLQDREFTSWTCPRIPGVISIKPSPHDVILAINRLVKYLNWKKFAFAKFQFDKSPYCNEIATQLEEGMGNHVTNHSVLVFGKYEDLKLAQYSLLTETLQGLFLCISYDYGFTHNFAKKTELKYFNKEKGFRLPLVILPEWPLPLDIYSSKETSTWALMSHPHPFNFNSPQPPLEVETKPSWESFAEFVPLESQAFSKKKILEPLLARLILQSIKISLEVEEKKNRHDEGREVVDQSENLISSVSTLQGNNNGNSDRGDGKFGKPFLDYKSPSFRFLVFQFEKDRWHPVVNFPEGMTMNSSLGRNRDKSARIATNSSATENWESITTWLQIIGATAIAVTLVGSIIGLTLYARQRYQNRLYSVKNTSQKKLVRKSNQGPYKLLLTSRDICFSSNPSYNNDCNNIVPISFDGGGSCNVGGQLLLEHPQQHAIVPFSRTPSADVDDPDEKPDLIKGSCNTLKKSLSGAMKHNDSVVVNEDHIGRYKGDLVHLRKLAEPSESFEIKTKAMNVLETVHSLRNENLAALIGVLTDGIPAMVWEYCSRGSLHDVIKQQDIKLDWAFKLSLLTDLVRGMRYLHSSLVRVHGFLTSYNCVIDARWVLKITDYGVLSFHHNQGLPLIPRTSKELLWAAPELLRDESLRKHGTQPGDVYSFAIIMQEVLVRGEPYCMLSLSPEEILEKVKRPPPLIRPSVSKGLCPPEAINIMRQCWAELPESRPDFTVISSRFQELNHGRKANIVDTMFQMLEKYSNNLEELIRERTEQLDFEKKKTEQLLNRMLPSTVADKLKLGLPVDPEEFSEVTIYFSDIVGFTTISAYSTPFEVVDLLNDLYTCFDATINDYNVYKVETIGDAYMVVGGAPVRTKDHVDQIATMALDLLHQSGQFQIRHLPFTPLRLRIGIHTGPCCGGVVGLTMPRYCLFGDTVNTASRMESTGAPWRIHISNSTKSKLDQIGGYVIDYRGITDIKGKGKMSTYWLLGKAGFSKHLPEPEKSGSELHGMDEKSILYGRTGIRPEVEANLNLKTAFQTSRPNSQEGSNLDPGTPAAGKPGPAFTLVQGELLRCLSPAEEVAHQLLNGKPAARGLRRQFSLDQGSNYYIPPPPGIRGAFRKTPSLEETTDHSSSSNSSLSVKNRLTPFSTQISLEVPPPVPGPSSITGEKSSSDNKELFSNNKSNKITLSPRTGRIFIKSSSLTIVEESPALE